MANVKKEIRSTAGELRWNHGHDYVTADTPCKQAAVGLPRHPISLTPPVSPREYRTPAALKPCAAGLDWDRWTDQARLHACDPDLLSPRISVLPSRHT